MNIESLKPGSLIGGMLLVAGSCIGAGLLAIPIVMGLAGFFPSLSMMFLAWVLMVFTGLLLVEANGWFYRDINLLSMVQESLGRPCRYVAWLAYLFLFYSLLVAYIAASGSIFSLVIVNVFNINIPSWACSLFFTTIFALVIYFGTRPVDLLNRILMVGLIITYIWMITLAITRIRPQLLLQWTPGYLFSSLPVLVISFGFHNLIPSVTSYMRGDLQRVRLAIIGGSLIAFFIYLIWVFVVLGVVPYEAIFKSYGKGEEATIALQQSLGSLPVSSLAQGFAFFAVVTSFLAQGLTVVHFLADGFKMTPSPGKSAALVFIVLIPPLALALSYPQIFFKALNFAGGICAMVLFGILPALMVWVGRYYKKLTSNYHVRGGRVSLILCFGCSLLVIFCELARIFLY